jgi:hypothetical protein
MTNYSIYHRDTLSFFLFSHHQSSFFLDLLQSEEKIFRENSKTILLMDFEQTEILKWRTNSSYYRW